MSLPLRILDVKPTGFRVIIEHDLSDLKNLVLALDNCIFDSSNAEDKEAAAKAFNYVTNNFYPELKKFIKEIDNGS